MTLLSRLRKQVTDLENAARRPTIETITYQHFWESTHVGSALNPLALWNGASNVGLTYLVPIRLHHPMRARRVTLYTQFDAGAGGATLFQVGIYQAQVPRSVLEKEAQLSEAGQFTLTKIATFPEVIQNTAAAASNYDIAHFSSPKDILLEPNKTLYLGIMSRTQIVGIHAGQLGASTAYGPHAGLVSQEQAPGLALLDDLSPIDTTVMPYAIIRSATGVRVYGAKRYDR